MIISLTKTGVTKLQGLPCFGIYMRNNTPPHQSLSLSHHSSENCLCPHPTSWVHQCKSEGVGESKRTATQDDNMEERSSERESSRNGNVDDEDADEESLQMSPPTSQESEEPLVGELTRVEPLAGEAEQRAPKEAKPANDTGSEDMEVTPSKTVLTAGNLTPT